MSLARSQSLFDQAPPSVEQALRERVNGFYSAQKAAKWDEATDFVASDSRAIFAKGAKREVKKFDLVSITWASGFTEAKVVTGVDIGNEQGFALPELSFWRLEKGKWFWCLPTQHRKGSQ